MSTTTGGRGGTAEARHRPARADDRALAAPRRGGAPLHARCRGGGRRTAPRRPLLSALGRGQPRGPGHPALPHGRLAPADAAALWGVCRGGHVSLHVSGLTV